MSSRIPPLIEPYLALPSESLVLITSVLGASSNWLVLRFLHSTLLGEDAAGQDDTKVLLVSFMRDLAFWKENARRLGLDLDKLAAKKKFSFVDGLGELFLPRGKAGSNPGTTVLSSSKFSSVFTELQQSIERLKEGGGKVVLVVDQIDLLLAATSEKSGNVELLDMIMGLREIVHSIILTVSADQPLLSTPQAPLETDHAAFLLALAHDADLVLGLRLLDSGTARDVSGVIRITVRNDHVRADTGESKALEEQDLLYFVGGDGGVKIFERGQ